MARQPWPCVSASSWELSASFTSSTCFSSNKGQALQAKAGKKDHAFWKKRSFLCPNPPEASGHLVLHPTQGSSYSLGSTEDQTRPAPFCPNGHRMPASLLRSLRQVGVGVRLGPHWTVRCLPRPASSLHVGTAGWHVSRTRGLSPRGSTSELSEIHLVSGTALRKKMIFNTRNNIQKMTNYIETVIKFLKNCGVLICVSAYQ